MSYYQLSVSWGPRAERMSACATRFVVMLEKLAAEHSTLASWFKQARTRATAFESFCIMPPRQAELEEILHRGRQFTSGSRELIPELGYSVAAWNGQDEPYELSFHVRPGGYNPQLLYPNEVCIPTLRPGNRELLNAVVLKRILLTIADCWDADWSVVETWDYQGKTLDAQGRPLLPYGGWLTYLSPALAEKVSSPPDIAAESLPNGALFMLATEEQFDVANPVHVANLDAIQKALAPVQRSVGSVGT